MGPLLYGAMQGLGEGGAAAAAQYGREAAAANIEKMKEEAATARETALVEARRLAAISVEAERQKTEMGYLPAKNAIETAGKIQVEAAKPITLGPAQTVLRGDELAPYTAPEAPSVAEEHRAYAARAGAEKSAIEAGERYGRKGAAADKPAFIKAVKMDPEGQVIMDENTSATGTLVPSVPGRPAETHWYGNKPEIGMKPASRVWSIGGETLSDKEYYDRFYGGTNKQFDRGGKAGSGIRNGYDPDTGKVYGAAGNVIATLDPKSKTLEEDARTALKEERSKASATPAASVPGASGATTPGAQVAAPAADSQSAQVQALEAVQAHVAQTTAALRKFGVLQQTRDPEGYARARKAVDLAREQERSITDAYVKSLPDSANRPAGFNFQSRRF